MIDATAKSKISFRVAAAIVFLGIGFALGLFTTGQTLSAWPAKIGGVLSGLRTTVIPPVTNPTTVPTNAVSPTLQVVQEESQVIDVVKRAAPAVVSIVASADVPNMQICYENPFGDEFQGLPGASGFDFRIPTYCQNGTTRQRVGAGTGYLVSADGYIMTNKHVVEDTQADYTVILNDANHRGEQVKAKVLAKDPSNDIAVLKIEKTGLPFLQFGNSDQLQVGQTAIAIGYSLGEFDNTVSKGVVSGLRRSIQAGGYGTRPEQLDDIIQTDAAINPGNSGGPLLNIAGNVIGMNVAMAQAQSIGFAIPANAVAEVFDQVKSSGKIQRPWLGIRYLPITKQIQERNQLTVDYGALLVRGENLGDLAVVPGSPADIAGLVENDIILEIDGIKIKEPDTSLAQLVAKHKVGDTIQLKILRKGKEQQISVKLESR